MKNNPPLILSNYAIISIIGKKLHKEGRLKWIK